MSNHDINAKIEKLFEAIGVVYEKNSLENGKYTLEYHKSAFEKNSIAVTPYDLLQQFIEKKYIEYRDSLVSNYDTGAETNICTVKYDINDVVENKLDNTIDKFQQIKETISKLNEKTAGIGLPKAWKYEDKKYNYTLADVSKEDLNSSKEALKYLVSGLLTNSAKQNSNGRFSEGSWFSPGKRFTISINPQDIDYHKLNQPGTTGITDASGNGPVKRYDGKNI